MLQRVLPCGGRVASVTTRATFEFEIDGLRPRPGLSSRPARPDVSKRPDHRGNALGRCFQPLSNSLDADAVEPQQNDVGAFLVSRTDGGRPRPATKFFRDIPLRVQSLDGAAPSQQS